jgi:hypothetical protein
MAQRFMGLAGLSHEVPYPRQLNRSAKFFCMKADFRSLPFFGFNGKF